MPVIDLYSKRRKRELGESTDVYKYDEMPHPFRHQIIHLWADAIGAPGYCGGPQNTAVCQDMYLSIAISLRREYGLANLSKSMHEPRDRRGAYDELKNWFLTEQNVDRVLDCIELSFQAIEGYCSRESYLSYRKNNKEIAASAVDELNTRFREHALGYQYTDEMIVRVDSQLIHAEAVVPALTALREKIYSNAQSEFLNAYDHFRHGKKPEALVECLKAFESTMKVICNKRSWSHDPGATAKDLIKACYENGLIPSYWQTHFSGLRSVLESGVPTVRNRQGGHGAGAAPPPAIPDHLVAYALHMTASTILFLSEAEKKLP